MAVVPGLCSACGGTGPDEVAVVGPVSVTQGTSPWVVSGGLTDAQLRASAVPVSLPAGATKVETITRYNTVGTRTVGAASFSYSVTVISAASSASPTLGGVALPAGFTASYSPRNADVLTGLSLITASGDDVIVTVIP